MKRLSVLIFGVCSAALLPSPLSAADFEASPAMIPYIYRYGACVFNSELGETEARIARCPNLRKQIEENAAEPFAKWHRGERPRRNRQFERMLNLLEAEARASEEQRKPVPKSVVAYMKCMGGPLINDDNFRDAIVLNFDAVDRVCIELVGQGGTEIENERARKLIGRLRLRGREHFNLAGAPRTIRFRRGFLGLHRLPSDGELDQ